MKISTKKRTAETMSEAPVENSENQPTYRIKSLGNGWLITKEWREKTPGKDHSDYKEKTLFSKSLPLAKKFQ